MQCKYSITNLKSKNQLDRRSSANDAVTGMVDKQEVHDTKQSHESCRKPRTLKLGLHETNKVLQWCTVKTAVHLATCAEKTVTCIQTFFKSANNKKWNGEVRDKKVEISQMQKGKYLILQITYLHNTLKWKTQDMFGLRSIWERKKKHHLCFTFAFWYQFLHLYAQTNFLTALCSDTLNVCFSVITHKVNTVLSQPVKALKEQQ